MNLREWQNQAYQFFEKNPNSIYSVVTGGGKSFFAIYCIKKLLEKEPNLKVLIIAPKNVILDQTWLDELHTHGFPINRVGLFNMDAKEFSQITLCSIQSLGTLINLGLYDYYDCIIFDEIHNYGTTNYLKHIRIPKKYKIGLSATLEREDSNDIEIKRLFNYKIFDYNIERGIEDKVINKFDFYHYSVELDSSNKLQYDILTQNINKLIQMAGTGRIDKIKDEQKRNQLLKYINDRKNLVDKYFKKMDVATNIIKENIGSKIIVFNQYNIVSKNLYWRLIDDEIRSDIINSDISKPQQIKAFKEFEENKNNILLTTTMLDEGSNLPRIDTAILMSQNSTTKQFIQRMGRVLRKKDITSKVYYITVKGTYEEQNYMKKLPLIKKICQNFYERTHHS